MLLAGCVSPKSTVSNGTDLAQYQKVYIGTDAHDPRAVLPRVVQRLKKCGFEVVEVGGDNGAVESQGSGFIVDEQGHLLTCAHVLGQSERATAWVNGKRHLGRVVMVDTNLDLALVRLEGAGGFQPVSMAGTNSARMGQDAFTMGFPLADILGLTPRLNKGLINSTVGINDDPRHLQISAAVQPGNSGGPLLNSDGEVIGVVASTLNPLSVMARAAGNLPQNVNFALKNGPVLEFLARAGVSLRTDPGFTNAIGFEKVQESLALVRSGEVTDAELRQPTLACLVRYLSFWDLWFRFQLFRVEFTDVRTGDTVLAVEQRGDNVFVTEDGVMDKVFQELYSKFHPGQPNVFDKSKEKPEEPAR